MTQLIDLGKLRFHFAGDWASGTQYESNDIVKYGGNVYVYTYALKSAGVLPTTTTHWALMVEGFKFKGVYSSSTAYKVGDGIAYGGKVYISILDSTNQTPPNATYWSLFADGIQYEGAFSASTSYQRNDVVTYGGQVYIAKQDTSSNNPTNATYWDRFVDGISPKSVYNNSTAYVPNDLVAYGANIYRALSNTTGNLPTNATYWEIFVSGFEYQAAWSSSTQYYIGQVVSYGGSLFQAITDNNNINPTTTATWDKILSGFKFRGEWTTTTSYGIDEVVVYGGNTFISLIPHASVTFATDLAANKWQKFNSGVSWKGNWTISTFFKVGDIVKSGGSAYIAKIDHTSDAIAFNTDYAGGTLASVVITGTAGQFTCTATSLIVGDTVTITGTLGGTGTITGYTTGTSYKVSAVTGSAGAVTGFTLQTTANVAIVTTAGTPTGLTYTVVAKWEEFAIGGADVIPPFDGDNVGQSLSVLTNGSDYGWLGATASDKVFYVAPHGQDIVSAGRNLSTPFASIKYACEQSGPNATIFVKTGTFTEELPIIVPANTAIVGDNQRTTIVEPAAGFETGTMFKLSNGSILNKMTFKGMTGWVPGATAADITTSTPAGIAVAFNEASPVTTKSPYVLECSFIGVGGIGVYVNGSAHASGNKSMIFHGYTIISDNGVGYWVNNGGLAELVSNFTYYCTFGYTCTNGSKIRSLNGNCSYGLYGATSQGYDVTETPITGTLVGQQLNAVYVSGTASVGDTITDTVTGATATILNVQYSADKVYINNKVGTFGAGNNCTTTSGGLFTTAAGAAENVDGFILIVTGLSETPRPGGSISLAGDSIAYVIQSVSGTYVNSSSNMIIVLSQEKPTGSAAGTAITIRYRYSEVRLTGHDFLSVGTGGFTTTNHPGVPTQPAAQGNEVVETFPGRVYYVSTDQSGNFRVGEFFRIDQATGTATLNANAFNLAGLTSLRLGSIGAQLGESINEFSSDATLAGNSNLAVPTEYSVKTYVDNAVGAIAVDSIPFVNTVSANGNLASNAMRFSMNTLTISGSSVYIINLDAYHFVMNPSGFALLAS